MYYQTCLTYSLSHDHISLSKLMIFPFILQSSIYHLSLLAYRGKSNYYWVNHSSSYDESLFILIKLQYFSSKKKKSIYHCIRGLSDSSVAKGLVAYLTPLHKQSTWRFGEKMFELRSSDIAFFVVLHISCSNPPPCLLLSTCIYNSDSLLIQVGQKSIIVCIIVLIREYS